MKTLTSTQVQEIASQIAQRWEFIDYGSYYNCIDTKTGQRSNNGGDYNFSHYNFHNMVEVLFLSSVGEKYNYFDWQLNGVSESNERKGYIFNLCREIVDILKHK